jgi:phospholipid-binding lipoprotein MlaA
MNSFLRIGALAAALALSGCATNNPKDPLEPFNRAMFSFNDTIDRAALKPAAEVYSTVLPGFVQTGIGNFFGNLGDVWTALNNFLQGKMADGLSDVMRVALNTTMGFGGVLDIGTEAGLTKHSEDFGQTLGKWGVKSGAYVVLPFLGSSTVRDTAAMPLDFAGDVWHYKRPVTWRNTGTVVHVVDLRASVLDASNLLEEAALDRYVFVRDAYLQRRQSKVYDGEVPSSKYEDDIGPTADAISSPKQNEAGAELAPEPVVKLEQNGGNAIPPAKDNK